METNKLARAPQTSDKFILRLPDGMRERIANIAKENSRSMNAEIIARLQESFEPNLSSLNWLDLVQLLQSEAQKRGTAISITVG